MRPSTLRLWLAAFGVHQPVRVGFLSWLLEITKTGEKLGDREKTALLSWLADNGHDDFPLQDCFTVQYSLSECAAALGCKKTQAKRCREWAVSLGLLAVVRPGRKGCSGLYLIAPVGDGVTKTGENVTLSNGNRYTKTGENVYQYELVHSAQYVHIDGKIGTHAQRCDLGYGVPIQNNYPEVRKDISDWVCPSCAASCGFELCDTSTQTLAVCASCGSPFALGARGKPP